MVCCWVEDPSSEAIKLHLSRIKDYLWVAEDGMKMQVFDEAFLSISLIVCYSDIGMFVYKTFPWATNKNKAL